jgi:PAS domain S-box-containing protein
MPRTSPLSATHGNEELYRRIIETTHLGVCIADPDYRYTFANRRLCEMLGYEPDELVGMTVFDLMDEAGGNAQRARIERRRQGKPESGELALKRKDGSEVWVMFESHSIFEEGHFHGVLSMMMDISERRRIEGLLQRGEAQLREAQHVAQLGSWEWDLRTNALVRSEECRHILGVVGLDAPAQDRIHPDDRARVLEARTQSLRDGKPWTCDYRVVRDDGVRVVHARGEVVVDAAGEPVRMVGTVQDVTDKKEAEVRMILADRLVSMGTLALGVAHEINNPLASVTANLDLICEGLQRLTASPASADVSELREMAHEAREAAERVRSIVGGLKTFSRGDEDRPVALDLRRVLEVATNLTFNEIRHRAMVVKDYGDVPTVLADEGRLGQVFIHLLENAAESFPEGPMASHEIRVVTRTLPDGRALAEVHDTGPGIPGGVIARIFDPFFTTKAVGIGTGLGLSVCHGIVTGLGGELTVESTVGKGSVFRVVLPPAPAPPETAAIRPGSLRPEPAHRATVLIVDDDAVVAKTLSRVLKDHDLAIATNGREALDMLLTGRAFDVILCDLMMPVMNGMELHAELKATLPHVVERVVFITGGAFTPSTRAFLDSTPNECLQKPYDVGRLRALVQKAAGRGARTA